MSELKSKLEWYRKLAAKLDKLISGEMNLADYREEVLDKIAKLESEVRLEEFDPNNWCIHLTKETRDAISDWWKGQYPSSENGHIMYMFYGVHNGRADLFLQPWGSRLNLEQFKIFVLKESASAS